MQGIVFILSGPSGVGKGTLVKMLLQDDPTLTLSVSCTTRAPRQGEKDGREYFFINREEFLSRIEKDDFLEYDEHFGSFYGTPRSFVYEHLKDGSVVLEIDVEGALKVQNKLRSEENSPRVCSIMITPPSLEELERRLLGRKTETKEQVAKRMERVRYELTKQNEYDYVIINDDLQEAKSALTNIMTAQKSAKKETI